MRKTYECIEKPPSHYSNMLTTCLRVAEEEMPLEPKRRRRMKFLKKSQG